MIIFYKNNRFYLYIEEGFHDDPSSYDFSCSCRIWHHECCCGTLISFSANDQSGDPELEKHYNGLLFERLGKKLYLTDRGTLLLPQARELVNRFTEVEELMLNQGQTSILKLGSTLTVGTCLTPTVMLKLEESTPGLEVHSYVSNTLEIEQNY